jgi:hypothetical protein
MAEPCLLHDLENCADCQGGLKVLTGTRLRSPRPRPPSSLGPWFDARFDGECENGCAIQEGDTIRSDGEGGWLCRICGDDDG